MTVLAWRHVERITEALATTVSKCKMSVCLADL